MGRVVGFDLDETVARTSLLLEPATRRVAEVSGRSVTEVNRARWQVGEITFTFADWFRELGIEAGLRPSLELELRQDIGERARSCLYPGIRALLEVLKGFGDRLVLITAGDPFYQRWKFGLLGLDDLFAVEDQHYVPRYGSKAEVLRHYLAYGEVDFIDDNPDWHLQVIVAGLDQAVRRIRPCWPENPRATRHDGDNERWHVVRTPAELLALLRR